MMTFRYAISCYAIDAAYFADAIYLFDAFFH